MALGDGLALKSHKPKGLRIFFKRDLIAQDVVVSGSAPGSIIPAICNLAIACIYHTGIPSFLSIVMVNERKSAGSKCITIRKLN